jgi:hypothetical protein
MFTLGDDRLAAEVRVVRRFPVAGDVVTALDDVDLDIPSVVTVVAGRRDQASRRCCRCWPARSGPTKAACASVTPGAGR